MQKGRGGRKGGTGALQGGAGETVGTGEETGREGAGGSSYRLSCPEDCVRRLPRKHKQVKRWNRWRDLPTCPTPQALHQPLLRNAALPLSRPHLWGPLLLTCTLAALRSLRGTAPGWTEMWRTGLWRWTQWWPPQRKVECKAGGQAGLWGGVSGDLWEPGSRACCSDSRLFCCLH